MIRTRQLRKLDSDTPLLPSMDDFNFTEEELATADPASGTMEWGPPYFFSNGNTRGLTWDSGSLGDGFVNTSLGFLDQTGQLLAFLDAQDPEPLPGDTARRFVKAQFRFYYRHPARGGCLKLSATFAIRKARLRDHCMGSGVELLDFQNFRLAAYSRSGDYWHPIGKAVDEYHQLEWAGASTGSDRDQPAERHQVVLTTAELARDQLCKFYVGIWSGLTLRTEGSGYSAFNELHVRLDKVRAEVI